MELNALQITVIALVMLLLLAIRFVLFYKRLARKYYNQWTEGKHTSHIKRLEYLDLIGDNNKLHFDNQALTKKLCKTKNKVSELEDRLDYAEFAANKNYTIAKTLHSRLKEERENLAASKQVASAFMHQVEELQTIISRKQQPRKNGKFAATTAG